MKSALTSESLFNYHSFKLKLIKFNMRNDDSIEQVGAIISKTFESKCYKIFSFEHSQIPKFIINPFYVTLTAT